MALDHVLACGVPSEASHMSNEEIRLLLYNSDLSYFTTYHGRVVTVKFRVDQSLYQKLVIQSMKNEISIKQLTANIIAHEVV